MNGLHLNVEKRSAFRHFPLMFIVIVSSALEKNPHKMFLSGLGAMESILSFPVQQSSL